MSRLAHSRETQWLTRKIPAQQFGVTDAHGPPALLAAIEAERLPFASGAFSRALKSLVVSGYLAPAASGVVTLTERGAAERTIERERWSLVLPALIRLLGDESARLAPGTRQ